MNSGIYKWTSPSGKGYIGKAVNLKTRYNDFINREFYTSRNGNTVIDKARLKYPNFDEWKYEVIEYCNPELIEKREKYWIDYYDTFNNGYNSTLGGEGALGHFVNEETKKKISSILKGKKKVYKNGVHPMYNKKHSDESKRKMSEKNKGHIPWNKGIKMSIDFCDKIKKIHNSKEWINNLKNSKYKPISQYTLEGEFIRDYNSALEAEELFGFNKKCISNVLKGKSKSHKGYIWKYKNNE